MIALLLPHTGAHAAQHAPLLACLPPIFRRAVAAVRRKPAAPETTRPSSGAATPTRLLTSGWHDGLSDREIAALRPRKVLPRADGDIVIDEREHVHVRPAGGRSLGDLPRRKPMVNRQPWQTAEMPVYGQKCTADVLADEQAEAMLP